MLSKENLGATEALLNYKLSPFLIRHCGRPASNSGVIIVECE